MGKMFYFCGGEMAEWSAKGIPSGESLFLRKTQTNPDEVRIFILGRVTVESLLSKGNKVPK